MAANTTQISGAQQIGFFLRNYPWATVETDMPLLTVGLATDLAKPVYRGASGVAKKLMVDASGASNFAAGRIPYANSAGEMTNASGFSYDAAAGLSIGAIVAASTDTDAFLVSDSGVVKKRTGAQVLSDIGGEASGAATTAVSSHESTYNHANFATAYGWGNHATAGYLTAVPNHGVTTGTVPKSNGTNAWVNSIITDNGTTASVGGNLSATGTIATAAGLTADVYGTHRKGSSDAVGYTRTVKKSRGTVGSPTYVNNGDAIESVEWQAWDNNTSGFVTAAKMTVTTPAAGAGGGINGQIAWEIEYGGGGGPISVLALSSDDNWTVKMPTLPEYTDYGGSKTYMSWSDAGGGIVSWSTVSELWDDLGLDNVVGVLAADESVVTSNGGAVSVSVTGKTSVKWEPSGTVTGDLNLTLSDGTEGKIIYVFGNPAAATGDYHYVVIQNSKLDYGGDKTAVVNETFMQLIYHDGEWWPSSDAVDYD